MPHSLVLRRRSTPFPRRRRSRSRVKAASELRRWSGRVVGDPQEFPTSAGFERSPEYTISAMVPRMSPSPKTSSTGPPSDLGRAPSEHSHKPLGGRYARIYRSSRPPTTQGPIPPLAKARSNRRSVLPDSVRYMRPDSGTGPGEHLLRSPGDPPGLKGKSGIACRAHDTPKVGSDGGDTRLLRKRSVHGVAVGPVSDSGILSCHGRSTLMGLAGPPSLVEPPVLPGSPVSHGTPLRRDPPYSGMHVVATGGVAGVRVRSRTTRDGTDPDAVPC